MMFRIQGMRSKKGITLIELLIVVMIVGVLAAVAVPAYTNYLIRGRRADAKTALEQVRAAQEMWRAEKGCYALNGVNCLGGALPGTAITKLQTTMGAPPTTVGDYTWSFTNLTANSFTAQAAPNTTRQTPDGALTINQDGKKLPADKWAK